jgi:uncharacterized protein (TIRG00374 family)
MKKPLFKHVAQWGLALVLLLALIFFLGDFSQLKTLPKVRWDYVFLAFLCNVGFTLSHNFRWKGIVENLSPTKRSDFFSLYRYLIDSYAIGKIIPMDVSLVGLRSYYLKEFQKIPISTALLSVLLDRFLDVILFLILAVPSFLLITKATSPDQSFSIFLMILLGFALIVAWKKGDTFHFFLNLYRLVIIRWLSKVPWVGHRMKEGIEETEDPHPFRAGSVVQIMAWNFVKYIFLSFRFYLTGRALGISFPFVQSFFFLPFVQLSGLINVTPGGLGILEMGTYGALFFMGVTRSQILIFVLGQRILLFPMFLILFVLTHLFYFVQSRWRRFGGVGWK